uniref:SRCR domain-containing protein n=1 Tax=Branchiostoma floridae TaxID=7739 RepID=C3XV80_BRAFL|eukprot:XP_002611997.1 hypothetical protein BRAFLDRAFT_86956 [Branchiostoma floridae]
MGPLWRRVFLFSLLWLGLLYGAVSDDIGGSIYYDRTISLSGSPYDVTNDIIVVETATLTVEAGVRLLFPEGVGMTVLGRLIAEGTPDDRIVFDRKRNPPDDQANNVTRDHDIRLLGPTVFEGRVQVRQGGVWGSLCLRNMWWRSSEATVVCRQLGFAGGRVDSRYRYGTGRMAVCDLECRGNEDNIYQCNHDNLDQPPQCLDYYNDDSSGTRSRVFTSSGSVLTLHIKAEKDRYSLFLAEVKAVADTAERAKLRTYMMYTWLTPLLVVAVTAFVEFCPCSSVRVGYGDHCWIGNPTGRLVAFGVPVFCALLINAVLITQTLLAIRKAFNIADAALSRSWSSKAWVYVRISCLMGFTWILGFIVPYVDSRVLEYIFIVLNGSQGFLQALLLTMTSEVMQKCWSAIRARFGSGEPNKDNGRTAATGSQQSPGPCSTDVTAAGSSVSADIPMTTFVDVEENAAKGKHVVSTPEGEEHTHTSD